MRVVSMVVPVEIYDGFKRVFDVAEYCPNTETMCLPVEYFYDLMTHPFTLELVDDGIDLDINVCDDD